MHTHEMLLNQAGNQEIVNYSLLKYRFPPIGWVNGRRLMILSAGKEVGKRAGNRLMHRTSEEHGRCVGDTRL